MTLYDLLRLAHVLAIVVWVGGMFFAHFALRPAAAGLEPAVRVHLMHEVLRRFFGAVLAAALVTLASGLWMIGSAMAAVSRAGAAFTMPAGWTVMATAGIAMIAVFGHIRFALFRRLARGVQAGDLASAGAALGGIRRWVAVNLTLGVIAIVAVQLG